MLREAPGCQWSSTPHRPSAGDRSTPGIRGSWPEVLLTRPGAVLSSTGRECHVLKPPFPGEDQPCSQGQCPQAGAGLTLCKVEGLDAAGAPGVACTAQEG